MPALVRNGGHRASRRRDGTPDCRGQESPPLASGASGQCERGHHEDFAIGPLVPRYLRDEPMSSRGSMSRSRSTTRQYESNSRRRRSGHRRNGHQRGWQQGSRRPQFSQESSSPFPHISSSSYDSRQRRGGHDRRNRDHGHHGHYTHSREHHRRDHYCEDFDRISYSHHRGNRRHSGRRNSGRQHHGQVGHAGERRHRRRDTRQNADSYRRHYHDSYKSDDSDTSHREFRIKQESLPTVKDAIKTSPNHLKGQEEEHARIHAAEAEVVVLGSKASNVDHGATARAITDSIRRPMVPVSRKPKELKTRVIETAVSVNNSSMTGSSRGNFSSSLDVCYNGKKERDVEPSLVPDIRNRIGAEHILYRSMDGKLVQQSFTSGFNQVVDHLASDTYLTPFIEQWRTQVSQPSFGVFDLQEFPPSDFTIELALRPSQDYDPVDGRLISAYEHPECKPDPEDDPEKHDSKLDAKKEQLERRKQNEVSQEVQERVQMKRKSLAAQRKYGRTWLDPAIVPTSPRIAATPVQSFDPKIGIHLRPADGDDMVHVQEIYNAEITESDQARDDGPVELTHFISLLALCRSRSLPFIVAVVGGSHDVREASHPGPSRPGNPPKGKILGFGYLSAYQVGFTGLSPSSAKRSVGLNVFIHHEYRRNLIGYAIIDKLLHVACTGHDYKDTCEFYNEQEHAMFKEPSDSNRPFKLHFVYAEVLRGEDDPRTADFDKLLVEWFGFEKAFIEPKSHTVRGKSYDRVVYRRTCQPVLKEQD